MPGLFGLRNSSPTKRVLFNDSGDREGIRASNSTPTRRTDLKLFHKLAILGLAAAALSAFIQTADPAQTLREINEARAKASADARASGKPIDVAALQKATVDKAKAAVKGVDPAKIDPKLGFAWASLFSLAEMHKEACDSATRFLTSSPTADEKFRAQSLMMRSCNALGEGHMLAMMISEITPPTNSTAFQLASATASVYSDTINQKLGADEALKALDRVESLLPTLDKLGEKEGPQRSAMLGLIAETRFDILNAAGRKDEALAALDKGIASLPANDPELRGLRAVKLRSTMMNSAAPAIKVERSHGKFEGLEALKGKVVILDFFAHWCGPCIRSFPDMKKLYTDLQPQGLEIVGVTTYYGYYKRENYEKRDMARDMEFAKMGEFISEYQLPWPVAYGERANFEAYGITGIPHVTVLDRNGNVVKIKIGYSPDSFAKFREEIEKLVAAK